ncbi:sugar ABC transporter substrate-binding protein [Moorellaceae bacterium AZ2]
MKRIWSLLTLLVVCALVVAGCGKGQGGNIANNDNAGQKAKLTIWVYSEFAKDVASSPIKKATDQFVANNPGVEIEIVPVPYGSSSYRDKFVQAANGGGGPDIILADNIWVPQFAAMGLIQPLTDMLGAKKDEFFPATIAAATFNNEIYGVPFHTDIMALFYNKDAFKAAGINEPPRNWDEFRTAAIKLTKDGKYGYGLMAGWGGSFEWLPWLWQNGGDIIDSTGKRIIFNNEAGQEATEFFFNLLTRDKVMPDAAKTWKSWDELTAGFANQTVAMVQGMDVMYQKLKAMNVGFEWGVAPLPERKTKATTLGGGHWVINKNCKQPELAYKWIDFITSSENIWILDEYSRTSARKDADKLQKILQEPNKKVFYESLAFARPRPTIPEWTQIDYDTIQPEFMKVIQGTISPKEALENAAKKSQEILEGK